MTSATPPSALRYTRVKASEPCHCTFTTLTIESGRIPLTDAEGVSSSSFAIPIFSNSLGADALTLKAPYGQPVSAPFPCHALWKPFDPRELSSPPLSCATAGSWDEPFIGRLSMDHIPKRQPNALRGTCSVPPRLA